MNIHTYYISSILTLLLCSSLITQPMQQSSLTSKEKTTIGVVIVGFLATTYSFYRFLCWLTPSKSPKITQNSSTQCIKGVRAKGDVRMRQSSDSDEKTNFSIQCINGQLSTEQSGGCFMDQSLKQKDDSLDVIISGFNTPITGITATGIGKLLLYPTNSLREQKIVLSLASNDADYSLSFEDGTLNCRFGSYAKQKHLLQVWMPNTRSVKLGLAKTIECNV